MLYCYNCNHEFCTNLAFFCCKWIANVRIYGRVKFTALVITSHFSSHKQMWPCVWWALSHWLFGHEACGIWQHVVAMHSFM